MSNIALENVHLYLNYPLKMVIFHSYVAYQRVYPPVRLGGECHH